MKDYFIYADMTITIHEVVSAENEEQAKKIALEKFKNEPFHYAKKCDACTNIEITDVNEE